MLKSTKVEWSFLPLWGWVTLAVLTGFAILPLYIRWFYWAIGMCAAEYFMKRVN